MLSNKTTEFCDSIYFSQIEVFNYYNNGWNYWIEYDLENHHYHNTFIT